MEGPQKWAFISEDRSGPGKNSTDILALCGLQHTHLKCWFGLKDANKIVIRAQIHNQRQGGRRLHIFKDTKAVYYISSIFSIHSIQVYSPPLLIVGRTHLDPKILWVCLKIIESLD